MRDEWAWEGWELKNWKELARCVQAGSRSPREWEQHLQRSCTWEARKGQ